MNLAVLCRHVNTLIVPHDLDRSVNQLIMLRAWFGIIILPLIRKYNSVAKRGRDFLECLLFGFTRSRQSRPQQKSTDIDITYGK